MNPVNIASAKSPLITGPNCKYKWLPDFQTLKARCFDVNGVPASAQTRVVQSPVQNCVVRNNEFILALEVENIARYFVKPTSGAYFCCDVFEPGYGYLFTDCGGSEMVVLNSQLTSDANSYYRFL